MKIVAAIMLTLSLHVTAKSVSQTITLSGKDIPLTKVFTEIERQSGYIIMYNEEMMNDAKPITVDVKDYPLLDFMNETLSKQGFAYEIQNKTIFLKKGVQQNNNDAQPNPPIDVKGRVVDENGDPVEGATVTIKGTNKATSTNANGEFILDEVDDNATLIISSVNIETREMKVKSQRNLSIATLKKASSLNEVVINKGYYSEQQRLSTGNVVKVTSKDIEKSPVTNVLLAMQGRVAGMEITQATGLPGSGIVVRIRGQNSISNGNDPLYVVDGVPYQNQMLPGLTSIAGTSGSGNGYSTGNPLNYLNPGDIESIEILKDADATAIYGTRAANGVVLITTKKGKQGPTRVDINIQQGWGKVTRSIPYLNTRQYLDMRYEAYKNDGVDLASLTPQSNNYDLTLWDSTRFTDWNKELIGGTAHYSNVQLSLYGGSNYVQYRLGYNFNKQTTTFPGSFGDPKGSLNFSVNSSSANNKLKVQLSGNYQVDKNSLPNYDLSKYTDLAPDAPELYNEDGSLNWAPHPVTGFPTWENPLAKLNTVYKRRVSNLITNASFSYEIIPGLEAKVNAGYTSIESDEISSAPSSSVAPILIPYLVRESQFANSQNTTWIVEPQLNFTTEVGGGRLSALVGTTFQQNNSKAESFTGRGFNNDLVMEDIKAAASVVVDNTIDAVYKYNAVFGRLNYNYGDKYLFNLTGRRDGTSRFGPNKQFANFGAAGIAWVFTKEKFISKALPFLSFGKIRSSYGTTGSDQVGDYRFMNLYNYASLTIPYQNSLSLFLDGLYNPELAWEETRKIEGAIDLGFAKDRVLLSASYYRNRCSNQLTSYSVPQTTGASSVPANLDATVENSGLEITVNTTNTRSKTFRWTSSLNLTVPRNKLVSASSKAIIIEPRQIGHPLSTSFVYRYAGVDPATGAYQFYDGKGGLTFRPDTALDAVTFRPYSQKAINTGVRFYGGLQNSFTWRNFQLDILIQFVKRLGQTNQRGKLPGSFSNDINSHLQNQPISILDRWQQAGDNSLVQKYNQDFSIFRPFNFMTQSDAVWVDASFIRLENVSLSWQFPEQLRTKLRLNNARVYTQAQNLFTILTYKGSDPETRSLISLPPLKMIAVGIQLTF